MAMTFERIRRHQIAGVFAPRARVRYKSAPQAPTPAAPQVVSQAQTGSNVDTAIANATLGNVNQNGPLGSTSYQQTGGTMVDGNFVPSYTQNTSLNPTLQSILTGTENTANSLVPTGQALADEFSGSLNGPNNTIIKNGPQALDTNATNAIYAGENALLQPTFDEQQRQLQDQLSRQGIPLGSEAYGNAQTQLGTQQNQQRTAALGTATGQGIQSAGQMFNLALLGQQAPLQQLSQLYGATGTA